MSLTWEPRCSLAKALDRAPATVAAVAAALSNTAAAFPLGLPSLTKLLCNSSKRGKHAKALAVFAAAPALGLTPDLPLCNAALMAASSAGNAGASAMIFRQMVAQGLQPDSVSYRAAVTALVKHDHLREALQVRSPPQQPPGPLKQLRRTWRSVCGPTVTAAGNASSSRRRPVARTARQLSTRCKPLHTRRSRAHTPLCCSSRPEGEAPEPCMAMPSQSVAIAPDCTPLARSERLAPAALESPT